MVLRTILFILLMTKNLQSDASGFDAYSSCYRRSRMQQELPCDFGSQTWCTIPGKSYPWHAVRRFVHENQGLMRRMYGDERHISVLRAELESNDIEFFDSPLVKEEFRRRYSKDMDRTKEFVKMFMKAEGRKFSGEGNGDKSSRRLEKIKKSIDQTSNNVVRQNSVKNSQDEDIKGPSPNGIGNKMVPKMAATTTSTTTTTITPPPSTMETTYGTFMGETTVNFTTTATTTTAESTNSTSYGQTDPTVQPTPRTEPLTTTASNDTQYDETYEYDAETEETFTTTGFDDVTTTESFVEDAGEFPKDKSENYSEVVEGPEPAKEQTTKAPVLPEPSPMIRLKGINACPVKEEVVAPFWANNTRGEVLALLNLYPFEQYVHWEKCMYEHKQMFCREGCRCEQQYRLHRLLAYDPNNECRGIFSDWFRFPSCCVCKCYDLPMEFRLTSRSPRLQDFDLYEKSSSPFSYSSSAFKRFTQPEKQREEQDSKKP